MNHNSKLTSRAQTLRKAMTREERRLWYEYLHNYPVRFRRQVTCGNYILDFVRRRNWQSNWMVRSTMSLPDRRTMHAEARTWNSWGYRCFDSLTATCSIICAVYVK